jgi:hypothetical protein
MKKSFLDLIYAALCLFFITLLAGLGMLIGPPQLTDPNTPGYYLLIDLPFYLLEIGGLLVMLVGSPFAFSAYFKTKPQSILTSMIIVAFAALTFYGFPRFLILPLALEILGYFAYNEVKRLSDSKSEFSNPNSAQEEQ